MGKFDLTDDDLLLIRDLCYFTDIVIYKKEIIKNPKGLFLNQKNIMELLNKITGNTDEIANEYFKE